MCLYCDMAQLSCDVVALISFSFQHGWHLHNYIRLDFRKKNPQKDENSFKLVFLKKEEEEKSYLGGKRKKKEGRVDEQIGSKVER